MRWDESAELALAAIAKATASIANMLYCEELQHNIAVQSELIRSVLEAEAEAAEFIDSFSLQEINMNAVRSCKIRFLELNQNILLHIQKIQSYGYHLEEIYEAVQLEILTLSKEIALLK